MRPDKVIKKIWQTIKDCHAIVPLWNMKFYTLFISTLRLFPSTGFKAKEIYLYDLTNLTFKSNTAKFCSKNTMLAVQTKINPSAWQNMTADKGIFYRYCQTAGLPIPELYGIFFKEVAGWSNKSTVLKTQSDWKLFFTEKIPSEFIIKPAQGAWGKSILLLRRTQNRFFDNYGKIYTADELYQALKSHQEHDSFIVQERLTSHPDIVSLSGSENIQTARIITFIDKNGKFHILHAQFKPIVGPNVIDNFDSGLTGNLVAEVSPNNGVFKSVIRANLNGSGFQIVTKHPTTGVSLEGWELPLWDEALETVEKAAFQFLPKRSIGWDLAFTSKGVFILEGNGRYDPPLTHSKINKLIATLTEN